MKISVPLDQLYSSLEQFELVGNHKNHAANIHNVGFQEIKNCCSLSNKNILSLFYHRVCTFFLKRQWLTDSTIGINWVHECLWINSKVASQIKHQTYENKDELLAQIDLVDKIFNEIFRNSYGPHNYYIFPVEAEDVEGKSSFAGTSLADELHYKIAKIKQIYSKDMPHLRVNDMHHLNIVRGLDSKNIKICTNQDDVQQVCKQVFNLKSCNKPASVWHYSYTLRFKLWG